MVKKGDMTNGNGEPTGTQRLGERLQDWFVSLADFLGIGPRLLEIHSRKEEVLDWFSIEGIPRMRGKHLDWAWQAVFAILYWPTGIDLIGVKEPVPPGPSLYDNPSQAVGDTLRAVMENSTVAEIAQTLGAFVTDPVLGALEAGLEAGEDNPHEAARAFHGVVAGISSVSGLTSTVVEAATAGQIDNAGQALEGLYWNLGLGFLGWQTLAPLLENGLQPPLRRHYNKKYRPERFTAAQMSDLFALGKVSAQDVRDVLVANGWRDDDIQQWIDLSYRNLSEGDVWALYHDGILSKSQTDQRLRALGYNPDDLSLLHKANEETDTSEVKDVLLSTAKNAYKEDLISVDDFTRILREQKRTEEEITLQLALLDMQKAEVKAEFSRSEVRQLYRSRTIARPEAVSYLVKTDLQADQAELLLNSWEEEDAPEPLRINQSTIREAFTDGVLTRSEAKDRLEGVGYQGDDAELLLQTWETEAAPTAPVPGPRGEGALSLSVLAQFAAAGLITETAMAARPELERFDQEDRDKLIVLMYTVPPVSPTELSESILVEAYRFAILSREDLAERLAERGLSESDVALALEVVDRQIEEEREGQITGTIRRPSVGSLQLALQRGLIDEGQFQAQLQELGFTDDAVRIYLFNAQYQAPAKPANLTRATVLNLYRDNDITRSDCQYRLVKLGYTVADAQLLIKNQRLTPADTEVGEAYLSGLMFATDARVWFEDFGFDQESIDQFFDQFPPAGL